MGPSAGATATPTPTWAANPAPGPIASAPPLASAASGTVPTESGRSGAERLVTGLIIVAVIGGAILVPNGGRLPSSASVATGEVPPAGSIWFGDTFDSDPSSSKAGRRLLEQPGRSRSLLTSRDPSTHLSLAIRVYYDGALVSSQGVDASGSSDIWGFSPGPLFAAGEWRYELIEIGGNVLASGTITATQ